MSTSPSGGSWEHNSIYCALGTEQVSAIFQSATPLGSRPWSLLPSSAILWLTDNVQSKQRRAVVDRHSFFLSGEIEKKERIR